MDTRRMIIRRIILTICIVIIAFALIFTCCTLTTSAATEGTNKTEDIAVTEVTSEPLIINESFTSSSETEVTEEPVETEEPEPTETVPTIPYTDEDLDLLARLIMAEAGMSWASDELQLYVGSVVLNRMNHPLFPDTLYNVIYATGQYSPTWTGSINNTPSEQAIKNAKYLLENGSVLPDNVVFQANFKQGDGVYLALYDETLGTTEYFCYIDD